MSQYSPISGTILRTVWDSSNPQQIGCTIRVTLQTMYQEVINITVDGSTYILDNQPLNTGDSVTFFYSLTAPVPLIYPPLYRAVAAVHTPSGMYAALDIFTQNFTGSQMVNSDNTLVLNIASYTVPTLPNGQPFVGSLSGRLLLVTYGATTRSIPAQTTPKRIIVFCEAL